MASPFSTWRRRSILKKNLLWEPPPNGFLKLNFDGSYFPHIQMGGIRGVIRDFSGNIVKNFAGSMNCVDSNGAEMYALLVGCHDFVIWEVFMQLLKVILSLQFSGVLGSLLIHGL